MKSLSTLINPSRFAFLFKKELRENRKSLLLRSFIVVATLTAVSLLIGTVNIDRYDRLIENTIYSSNGELISKYGYGSRVWGSPEDNAAKECVAFFAMAFPIALAISASFMFENLSTKRKKIAMLMTPGTMFEKYFVRFLIYIAGTTILFFAGCIIADFIRYVIFSIAYSGAKIDVIHMFDYLDALDTIVSLKFHLEGILMYLSSALFGASLFALGSSVWPRLPFVKTFGAISAFGFVATITIILCAVTYSSGELPLIVFVFKSLFEDEDIIFNLISICMVFFSIFNFTLAYFRLKETEIIQRM